MALLAPSPAFSAAPAPGVEPDVLRHPVDAVAKGREQEKAWKKEAEQGPQYESQGVNAQPVDDAACLAQELIELVHGASLCL